MYGPYAANYDGDEMTLFPIYDELAVAECCTFEWDYKSVTSEFVSSRDELCDLSERNSNDLRCIQSATIATTTCLSDHIKHLVITPTHERQMTSRSSFVWYDVRPMSVMEFVDTGHSSIKSGAMKASHQSDIGALSRRSMCSAERVYLTPSGNIYSINTQCIRCLVTSDAQGQVWYKHLHPVTRIDSITG